MEKKNVSPQEEKMIVENPESLMDYYWSLFEVTKPQTQAEYDFVKSKLAIYNAVIVAVYTDALGNLNIPEDRTIRRDMLLNYNGTLPQGIIPYIDFAYGYFFEVEVSAATQLFLQLDTNGEPYAYTNYGVKVNGAIWTF